MDYAALVEVYAKLEAASKRLEKTFLLSTLFSQASAEDLARLVHLVQGRVFPAWDERKLGMSSMLTIKVIQAVTGESKEQIEKLWKKIGDLGMVAEQLLKGKKQTTLRSATLDVKKVFENLQKLAGLEGEGTVKRKVQLVAELLTHASPEEAKYIVKTILEELRIGVAEGIVREALAWAFVPRVAGIFVACPRCHALVPKDKTCVGCHAALSVKFEEETRKKHPHSIHVDSPEDLKKLGRQSTIIAKDERVARAVYNALLEKVQQGYNLSNDFGEIARILKEDGIKGLEHISIKVGNPINAMLAIKIQSIPEAFESIDKPMLCEYKLDGFRVQVHKKHDTFWLYTRRLENVTAQFTDLVEALKKHVKGDSYILDSEVIGYDPKTGKYLPFQHISQRIKRKYELEKTAKQVPVEMNVFDVLYYNGKSLIGKPQLERRHLLEKILKPMKHKIVVTRGIVAEKEEDVEKFYKEALDAGNEGLILKNVRKAYTPGRYVEGWLKLKPTMEPLDLTIIGATYGEGKRAHVLSSFVLGCKHRDGFVSCGMMGTGIKEKTGGGVTFEDLTKLLKPHIISEKGRTVKIKPAIVVEVAYEEIQKSPTYDSGFALRFPRLLRLRADEKKPSQANTLEDIKRLYTIQKKKRAKR